LKAVSARNARELSILILKKIITRDGFANLAIDSFLAESNLSKAERSFATQLVYGVMRHYNTLEWILACFTGNKIAKLKPIIKMILLTGIYQLIYLDKVPASAACNEAATLARKYGHQGVVAFVNGVLRNVARQKDALPYPDAQEQTAAHIAIKYSHPEWLVARWLQRYGFAETVKLCLKNNEPPTIWLRCNTLKIKAGELEQKLAAGGVTTSRSKFAPEGINIQGFDTIPRLPGYEEGLFQIQDESSMVVAHVVNPGPGTKIIDSCCGLGGKTTHLAQLMNDQGIIKAFDIYEHKLKLTAENCTRLGITIVTTQLGDATMLPESLPDWADYVLVDAPCSGTGVLGRRADARWRKTPEQLTELSKLQTSILTAAARCVKPGGVLVYCTCSLEPEENQCVYEGFIAKNNDFMPENLVPLLPFAVSGEDRENAAKGYFQFLPQRHGTDGFFVARMKRI
jgi:16S rRNA (cytosine967-C5)-methyltransferase